MDLQTEKNNIHYPILKINRSLQAALCLVEVGGQDVYN